MHRISKPRTLNSEPRTLNSKLKTLNPELKTPNPSMNYQNIGSEKESVSLSKAIFKGLAHDGSLYMPESIPRLSSSFFEAMPQMALHDMAFEVLKPFVQDEVEDAALRRMVEQTFSFPIPLNAVQENMWALELFHGPTHAFKDVGARFLSRLMSFLRPQAADKLMVLTATSGDTGGAVANGFHKVPGIDVVVLFPKGKISPYQQRQITNPGENIHAIAVEGSFDDCQRMVKQAFNDAALREKVAVTSANSINIGRLLPQMVYYFWGVGAVQRVLPGLAPVICVPSGNFGNLTAAVMAHRMGLPVKRFIAATNANDVVPCFLNTGSYNPRSTIVTIANAMDVGDPSNFSRLYALFNNNTDRLREILSAHPVSDETIEATIKEIYRQSDYLLDPHSAAAFALLKQLLRNDEKGFFVATAHPRKFVEVIERVLPEVSRSINEENGPDFVNENGIKIMPDSYNLLKDYLLDIY